MLGVTPFPYRVLTGVTYENSSPRRNSKNRGYNRWKLVSEHND